MPVAVMDPFHVAALAGDALDRCRQRIQQDTCGHRGRAGDPLYGIRRALRTGSNLLTDKQRTRLHAVFANEDHVEVEATWGVYQRVVAAYRNPDRPGTSNGPTEAICAWNISADSSRVPQPHQLHHPQPARDRRIPPTPTPPIGMSQTTAPNRISGEEPTALDCPTCEVYKADVIISGGTMRKKLTAALALVATLIAMLIAASPASATTSHQASDATPYCVVEAQAYQDRGNPSHTFPCYSDYTGYSNDINSYPNFVATMYTGKSYSGYRLAIVSYHGCFDGGVNYDKYVSDLEGSGFRDNIASSKIYGSNCTGGYAFNNAYYTNTLNINYGYDTSNGGYVPDWGAESDKADSIYIAHF